MEDKILVSYIKELNKGSHSAFNFIYDSYVDSLFSFAYSHTKSKEVAGDIVQDTFLKLWKNRTKVDAKSSLQSLLFTMTYHSLVDAFRKNLNKVELDLYIEYCDLAREELQETVESKIEYDDFVRILTIIKKQLPNRQLEIYRMSREEGKKINEIANELELSEQTVKNQLTSALKRIRNGLIKSNILGLIVIILFHF